MFPKPEPHKRAKAREQREARSARKSFRLRIVERDHYRCRACGNPVLLETDRWPVLANVHEIQPRSLGGSPLDPANCATLCGLCHPNFTHHRWEFSLIDPSLGANGPLMLFRVVH